MNSSAFKVAFSQVKAYLKREGLLSADTGLLCALSVPAIQWFVRCPAVQIPFC